LSGEKKMTPEQHNKYLALSHIVYGSFFILMMIAMMAFFGYMMTIGSQGPADGQPPAFFFVFIFGFMGVIYGAMVLPSFIAGYALLKRKSWAKIAAIVAGVMSGMSFPMGTAVCIYTFWFLFSEPGKVLYDQPAHALPPPPPTFANQQLIGRREQQYQPPDWR
jgi:hypothetical protein